MILELDFTNDKWTAAKAYPVYMQDKGHPVIASGSKKEEILNKIAELSQDMGTKTEITEDSVIFDIDKQ
jgi:hypothetical protein